MHTHACVLSIMALYQTIIHCFLRVFVFSFLPFFMFVLFVILSRIYWETFLIGIVDKMSCIIFIVCCYIYCAIILYYIYDS